MNQERKISALRNLLERVQKRASAPRAASQAVGALDATATPVAASASFPVAQAPSPAPPMAISAPPAQPQATSGRPGSSTLPLNFSSSPEAASFRPAPAVVSERPAERASVPITEAESAPAPTPNRPLYDPSRSSAPEIEMDDGPPSAPRLREGAEDEDEAVAEEQEIEEEEPQLKTPPPESGRQHVTPGPAAIINEPDEDISITVSMEESEAPPPVSPAPPEVSIPFNPGRPEISEMSGPQPRLALVSEPEIELHGMTPLAAIAEPNAPVKPPLGGEPSVRSAPGSAQDIDLAMSAPSSIPSIPSATPSGIRPVPPGEPAPATAASPPATPASSYGHPLAKTAQSPIADTRPSVSAAPPVSTPPFIDAVPVAPPVRLMTQPLADASGKPLPPVEVWASSFSPAALRGEIASFVGQNANFEPKSFGELVRASIALGEEKS